MVVACVVIVTFVFNLVIVTYTFHNIHLSIYYSLSLQLPLSVSLSLPLSGLLSVSVLMSLSVSAALSLSSLSLYYCYSEPLYSGHHWEKYIEVAIFSTNSFIFSLKVQNFQKCTLRDRIRGRENFIFLLHPVLRMASILHRYLF